MNHDNSKATAKEVKFYLLKHLIYIKNHEVAADEFTYGGGICDVLSVTRAGFAHEWEVKVSRQDLKSELDTIAIITEGRHEQMTMLECRDFPKLEKFRRRFMRHEENGEQPCMFSFIVPHELVEYATEGVKGTPYGVWSFTRYCERFPEDAKPHYQFREHVRAGKMHKEKFGQYAIMARRICFKHYFGLLPPEA